MADEKGENKPVIRSESGRPARMMNPFEEMDRMFESFFPQNWRPYRLGRLWSDIADLGPRVDVIDRDTEILLRAEIPGVDKENLEVSVADNDVTIRGTTHHEAAQEEGNYYRREISRGEFSRTIALPTSVDTNAASASFKNGVLELKLPKVEKAKRRTIDVS
jgi:HSP20 family protein